MLSFRKAVGRYGDPRLRYKSHWRAVRLRVLNYAQDSLIEPEDDGGGDCDGGHEGVGAPVITCVDTSPIFEFAEHILDFVSLTVEAFVKFGG